MDNNKIKVGVRVQYQNLVGIVTSKDGPDAWEIKINGSNQRITVPADKLSVILNEGHMESSRLEDYRKFLYD